ncbi:FKBP-type peptidyl-prolyl cis-trans isomerase [Mucilaginibacter lutimaris]|uniref:Peptidyl-prolyl cis-trans isomerase n=1 Tax=Mucilaginibacter lutimaris TaxID=931629 RepID=A0ABW2ZJJ1_9SPHI
MKKTILILSLFIAAFASCKKDDKTDNGAQAAKDEAAIQAYLTANPNIKATKDANGIYYQIITEGTGKGVNSTSIISVNYVGKLLNGTQFDARTGYAADMQGGIIQGWKYGLTHASAGSRILLIIPSALGYGTSPTGSIPANSVLVFTVDVLSVQ